MSLGGRRPPSATRRRAWLAIVCSAVAFQFIQVGANFALDATSPGWSDPEIACRLQSARHLIQNHAGRPVAVALGSSRTQLGLNPKDAAGDSSILLFNFSEAAAGPVRQFINLRRLLAAGIRPNPVLIEIHPRFLNQGPENVPLDRLGLFGWRDVGTLTAYFPDPGSVWGVWGGKRLACGYHFRKDILRTLQPAWDTPDGANASYRRLTDPHRWSRICPESVTAEQRERCADHARGEYRNAFRPFSVRPLPDRVPRDMLEFCGREGIVAAVYLMPEGSEFRSGYPPDALEAIHKYVDELAADHRVPLTDARTWMADEDFSDQHQLLPGGARSFSKRFGEEAILPHPLPLARSHPGEERHQ